MGRASEFRWNAGRKSIIWAQDAIPQDASAVVWLGHDGRDCRQFAAREELGAARAQGEYATTGRVNDDSTFPPKEPK